MQATRLPSCIITRGQEHVHAVGVLVGVGRLPSGREGEMPLGEGLGVSPVRRLKFRDDGVGRHISSLVSLQKKSSKFSKL